MSPPNIDLRKSSSASSSSSTVNAFSLEKAIFENRGFAQIERQTTVPEVVTQQQQHQQQRLTPRCACVTLNRPTQEDLLAPFIPPTCPWGQRPMRHALMGPYDSVPIDYLEELDETTSQSVETVASPIVNDERLLYKVQAPTVIKFTVILLCLWLFRSFHAWWMAKQSQLRFERLLASASFSDLVNTKTKSSSRVRTRAPKRETTEKVHQQVVTSPLQQVVTYVQARITPIELYLKTSTQDLRSWTQSKRQSLIDTLANMQQQSLILFRHTALLWYHWCHTCHTVILRSISSMATPSQTEVITAAKSNEHLKPSTVNYSLVSPKVPQYVMEGTGNNLSTRDHNRSARQRSSKSPVPIDPRGDRRERVKSPILESVKGPAVADTCSNGGNLLISTLAAQSDESKKFVSEAKDPCLTLTSPEEKVKRSFRSVGVQANTISESMQSGDGAPKLIDACCGPSVTSSPPAPRLCRLQAAVLCIESKEAFSCGTQTTTEVMKHVAVGVETVKIVLKDSSVQTTPPRRPRLLIQRNEAVVAEALPQTWTRIRMKELPVKPLRRRRRRLLGSLLMPQRPSQPLESDDFLQRTWIVGSSSSAEAADIKRLYGVNNVVPQPPISFSSTSTTPPPTTTTTTAAATTTTTPEGLRAYPSTTPEALTTCTTAPTPALPLQWVGQKDSDEMDTGKNSLEPPPGFERILLASAVNSQQPNFVSQHYSAHEPGSFISPPPPPPHPPKLIQSAQGFVPRSLPVQDMFTGGGRLLTRPPYVPPVTGNPLPKLNGETSCGAAHRTPDATALVDDLLSHVGRSNP